MVVLFQTDILLNVVQKHFFSVHYQTYLVSKLIDLLFIYLPYKLIYLLSKLIETLGRL